MWSLLGSLINNFLLLRDLFGYAFLRGYAGDCRIFWSY